MNTPRIRNIRLQLRRAVVALCCVALVGCYTLRPLGGPGPGLHEEIRAGRLVKAGDRVKITTIDGKRHEFIVRTIDDTAITGKNRSVPIEEIERIERAKLNTGRTLLLVGGVLAVMIGLMATTADLSPSFTMGGGGA